MNMKNRYQKSFNQRYSLLSMFAIFTLLCTYLFLIPSTSKLIASADTEYKLWIGGLEAGKDTDARWSFSSDGTKYTLTLNGYSYAGPGKELEAPAIGSAGIIYLGDKDLDIVLTGSNSIEVNGTGSSGYNYGIYTDSNVAKVTIKGTGSLTCKAVNGTSLNYGINCNTDLIIESGTLEAVGGDAANSGGSTGIFAKKLIINGGTTQAQSGTVNAHSFGIMTTSDITINNGILTATAKAASGGGKSYGIFSSGNTTITGGTVTASGIDYGIYSYDTTIIKGGKSDISGRVLFREGTFENEIAGIGWDNIDAAGEGTPIAVGKAMYDTDLMEYTTYKRVKFPAETVVCTATGFTGDYDGKPHGITISVTFPSSGVTVKYGKTDGIYDLDSSPQYTEAGTYTVYYKASAPGLLSAKGSAEVIINKTASDDAVPGNENPQGDDAAPDNSTILKKGDKVTTDDKMKYEITGKDTLSFKGTTGNSKNIVIPSTVTVSGIKYKVTSIAPKALKNNKKITNITIPASVTSIGKYAFFGTIKLKKVTIYGNITRFGAKAFYSKTGKCKYIIYSPTKKKYNAIVKKLRKVTNKNATFKWKKTKK